MAHNTLHVIGARCVARDLHTIVPWPLERTCWRQFAAQQGDCKKSRTAPLNAIIIIKLPVFNCCVVSVMVKHKTAIVHQFTELRRMFLTHF